MNTTVAELIHAKCSGSFISCVMYKQHNQSQALRYKQSWQLIQYWWLTKLQGPYIQVYETCHLRCDNYDNNSYYWHYWWECCICVCHLLLGSHYSHLAIMTILVNCTRQDNDLWTYWYYWYYLLLELVIMNLNAIKGHTEFWGKPLVLYCTVCNTRYNSIRNIASV